MYKNDLKKEENVCNKFDEKIKKTLQKTVQIGQRWLKMLYDT